MMMALGWVRTVKIHHCLNFLKTMIHKRGESVSELATIPAPSATSISFQPMAEPMQLTPPE